MGVGMGGVLGELLGSDGRECGVGVESGKVMGGVCYGGMW